MPSLPERAPAARPIRATAAFLDGWRRVLRAPALPVGMLVVTMVLAAPLAIGLGEMIEAHLGSSLAARSAASGWDARWASEFAAQAQGVGRSFTHEVLGFGGTLAIVSSFVDRTALNPALLGAVAAYLALWLLLWGGLIDRLARDRKVGAARFFAACGANAGRFIRLAIAVGLVYWAILGWLHPLLFQGIYGRLTRNMTAEGDAVVLRIALYAVFVGALVIAALVADVARVRIVVEGRRSALGAIVAGVRFIRRRPIGLAAVYGLNVLAVSIVVAVWYFIAPAADAPVWVAVGVAQVYLLLRICSRLAFMASYVSLFQATLAHAGYVAPSIPVWPDSPSAEALSRLTTETHGPGTGRSPETRPLL
jgi:hypothetical protein